MFGYDPEKREKARQLVCALAEDSTIRREYTLGNYDPKDEDEDWAILGEFYPSNNDPEADVVLRIYIDGSIDVMGTIEAIVLSAFLPTLLEISRMDIVEP